MKKITLLSVLVSTLIFAEVDTSSIKSSIKKLAFNKVDTVTVQIPMGLSLLGGIMKNKGGNTDWNPVYGLELSFECLLSPLVRSQLQYTHYNNDGIKMEQFSINPHYIFNRGDDVEFGFGPHLGAAIVEENGDDTIFTYGIGASLNSAIDENFFVGAEARYEWTTDATFGDTDTNLNNAKVFAKIGYSF